MQYLAIDSDTRGRFMCVIHAYYSRENSRILKISPRSRAGLLVAYQVKKSFVFLWQKQAFVVVSGKNIFTQS